MQTKSFLFILLLSFCACKKGDTPAPAIPPVIDTPKPPAGPDTCTRTAWRATAQRAFGNPCGMALSPTTGELALSAYNGGYGLKGNVAVYASVSAFLTQAAPIFTYADAKAPEALVFDAAGNLFIAETEATAGITILKRNTNGTYSKLKTIQGGLNNPRGMAVDADGRLYLCDDGNNRLVRFNAPLTSDTYQPVITGLGSPKGIARVGSHLFIAEYTGNRVCQWRIDSFAGPVATVAVTRPVDIAASDCVVAVGCPAQKEVQFFHPKVLALSAGTLAVGSQVFGMVLPAGKTDLLLSAYDKGQGVLYKP